jgi:hypothetical protein
MPFRVSFPKTPKLTRLVSNERLIYSERTTVVKKLGAVPEFFQIMPP